MHPIERMVQERHDELVRLSHAERGVRAARMAEGVVPRWRRGVGRALVAVAVAVGVPRARRPTARLQAGTVLGLEPHR